MSTVFVYVARMPRTWLHRWRLHWVQGHEVHNLDFVFRWVAMLFARHISNRLQREGHYVRFFPY